MKRVWALAALLAAIVLPPAGSRGAEAPSPVYQQGIGFGSPVRMTYSDPGKLGGPGEPSIKVDSQGTIYVAGVCCVVRAAPAWYSKDGGATWADMPSPGKAREWGFGAEGDFVVDDADSVYFSDTWVPSIFLTKWSGRGDVWEYTNDTVTVLPGVDDRPWLSYSHGAIYMYINHITHTQIWKSTDGGHSWQNAYNTIGAGQRFFPGNVAADRKTDDVYFVGRCNPGQSTICGVSSHDAGRTWSEAPVGPSPRGAIAPFMISTDVDSAGNVYATWADTNATGCDIQLAVSSDKGATWSQYKVNPLTGCSTFPWVAAGDDGRVALAWYHNADKKSQDAVGTASQWKLQSAVVTGAASASPVVTYGTLDRVVHRGPLLRDLWDFLQIAIGPDGRFHVAFVEDDLAGCNGSGLAGYADKCTDWVAQSSGPRAIAHAEDQTSVSGISAAAEGGSVRVSGRATFGRATPAEVVGPLTTTNGVPGFELAGGSLSRPRANSPYVVFELDVDGLPEAAQGTGQFFSWPFKVNGRDLELRMTPRPWRFEVCTVPTQCTRVRGDTDAGGDRLVAFVPLSAIGAGPGDTISKGAWYVEARVSTVAVDRADVVESFTVPGAEVSLRVMDASGSEVATSPAGLSSDLGSFEGVIEGLAPGTYTVEATACFAGKCATASAGEVTVA